MEMAIEEKAGGKQVSSAEILIGRVNACVFCFDDVKIERWFGMCKPNYCRFQHHQLAFARLRALCINSFAKE